MRMSTSGLQWYSPVAMTQSAHSPLDPSSSIFRQVVMVYPQVTTQSFVEVATIKLIQPTKLATNPVRCRQVATILPLSLADHWKTGKQRSEGPTVSGQLKALKWDQMGWRSLASVSPALGRSLLPHRWREVAQNVPSFVLLFPLFKTSCNYTVGKSEHRKANGRRECTFRSKLNQGLILS